jgi:hypothetical protein
MKNAGATLAFVAVGWMADAAGLNLAKADVDSDACGDIQSERLVVLVFASVVPREVALIWRPFQFTARISN